MEIRNDLNLSSNIKIGSSFHREALSVSNSQQSRDIQISIPGMREFSNALAMMQAASAIIQQALNVSGKLRDMAESTMANGRADPQEIALNISEIKSSMMQQGQSVSQPVIQMSPESKDILPSEKDIADLEKMLHAGQPDKARLDEMEESLGNKNKTVTAKIEELSARIGASGFRYETAPASVADTSRAIVNNASSALAVQGNIRVESVGPLIS
jgi:hypothetical protein